MNEQTNDKKYVGFKLDLDLRLCLDWLGPQDRSKRSLGTDRHFFRCGSPLGLLFEQHLVIFWTHDHNLQDQYYDIGTGHTDLAAISIEGCPSDVQSRGRPQRCADANVQCWRGCCQLPSIQVTGLPGGELQQNFRYRLGLG